MIGTRKGSWVVLECYIEAYPEPFVDWIYGDGQIIVENEKFNKSEEILESRISHSISRRVMLNITNVQNENLGLYKCLARNQLGRTYGIITLYGLLNFFFLEIFKRLFNIFFNNQKRIVKRQLIRSDRWINPLNR